MVEQGGQKGIIGRELGIAFVGVGRMGSQRATIAATHPAVRFMAVSDIDPARARAPSAIARATGSLTAPCSWSNFGSTRRMSILAAFA